MEHTIDKAQNKVRHVEHNPKIWVVSVGEGRKEILTEINECDSWTVASKGSIRDLVLFYHNAPESSIKDIFLIKGDVYKDLAGDWTKKKWDFFASIKRIAHINTPISFQEMKNDENLSKSHMVLMQMNGRFEATDYWDRLFEMIIRKNPELKKELKPFSP